MLNSFSEWLIKIANRWTILFFLAGMIIFNTLILPKVQSQIQAYSGGVGPLDLTMFPSKEVVFSSIAAYGDAGREMYRAFELSGDLIYPVVYAFLFSLIISALFKRALPAGDNKYRFNLLPFLTLGFDYLENIGIAALISAHPAQNSGLAFFMIAANSIKWIFAFLSIAVIIYGLSLQLKKK